MDETLILDVFLYVIPHSRQIQYYTAAVRFTHDYLDQYPKICLHNRKACFIFAS